MLIAPFPFGSISSFGVDQNNELFVCKLSSPGGIYRLTQTITGINGNTIEAEGYRLEQNYPNPFNPVTKIKFEIPVVGTVLRTVRLIIYNVLGQEITTLVNEQLKAGVYSVVWDASNYPSGVYFYKLTVDNQNIEKKMVLVK